jgi:hypothetical protein
LPSPVGAPHSGQCFARGGSSVPQERQAVVIASRIFPGKKPAELYRSPPGKPTCAAPRRGPQPRVSSATKSYASAR